MSGLQHAQSFRELIVYQKSRQLQREIFKITKSFPKDDAFSLTDQIRRSSRSIGANLAEAWAKRRYEKHFISKLIDSDGGRMLGGMMEKSEMFCGEISHTVREETAEYLAEAEDTDN